MVFWRGEWWEGVVNSRRCFTELCVRILLFSICNCKKKERERKDRREGIKATYNTLRCLNPAKSALVILVRLFAFRSLHRECVITTKQTKKNDQYIKKYAFIKQRE